MSYDLRGTQHERVENALAEQAERFEQHTTLRDLLISQNQLSVEMLSELRHLRAQLGRTSESRSSVEIKTSTRGVDIAAKSYDGSPSIGLVEDAVNNYFRAMREVQDRINRGGLE